MRIFGASVRHAHLQLATTDVATLRNVINEAVD